MGLDGNHSGAGPIVTGIDYEASHLRADIEDGSDVLGRQVVDAIPVMELGFYGDFFSKAALSFSIEYSFAGLKNARIFLDCSESV